MTAVIDHPNREETIPGLFDLVFTKLQRSNLKIREEVSQQAIDGLTIQEVYDACPFGDLIREKPPLNDMKAMWVFDNRLNAQIDDTKVMNQWITSICKHLIDANRPKHAPFWRRDE